MPNGNLPQSSKDIFSAELQEQMERYGLTPEEIRAAESELLARSPSSNESPSAFESFSFYTIPDLSEEDRTPPEFIVSGMIPCGMTFISGAPKIRKSFFALQLAASVATGQQFLGRDTIKCDVAYLDLEGSKSRAASRAKSMSIQVPRNVYLANQVSGRLADGSLVDDLQRLHQQNLNIRLIIIDTYSRARGSYKAGGANAYDADVALLEPMQRMALKENIAIVFIHHDKKGAGQASDSFERLSGTMGISGSADSVLNLVANGKRFDGKATLEYNPRDAKGGELSLEFDERRCEWIVSIENISDIRGNPICDWIIKNAPEKRQVGEFHSYENVFKYAYGCLKENCADDVRRSVDTNRNELFSEYSIGVQLGVKSNGQRGLRLVNLM